jgi:hypothetical protein
VLSSVGSGHCRVMWQHRWNLGQLAESTRRDSEMSNNGPRQEAQQSEPPGHGHRVGEPFIPFKKFNGLWVPEALACWRGVGPGPKLAYGRLMRYSGVDGRCDPSIATLGAEIGVGKRQTQKYLADLEKVGLIRRLPRFKSNRRQTSNSFEFLWHQIFESGRKTNDRSPLPANDSSHKESHVSKRGTSTDIDCPLTNRKERDSQADISSLPPSVCRQYPRVREVLCRYMMEGPNDERIYPTDQHVVAVMDAAGGASEEEVLCCLSYLYCERGLKPATRNGPRHFAWFPTVVADYFDRKREREEAANPTGYDEWEARNESR